VNKLIRYIFLLLITFPAFAQDSTAASGDIVIQETVVTDSLPDAAITIPIYTDRNFKPGFKDKYTGPKFMYETKAVPKTIFERLLEWMHGIFGSRDTNNSGINWIDLFIYVIAFLIIGFVVYLIAGSILKKEGMWIFGRSGKKITAQDAAAENIHEMDFDRLIEETKATGNYRLALRYYYLWVLKKLSRKEIINWHWDKTNSDYLYEIKDGNLRKDFEYLSYVYDHSWYGDFPVDEKSFTKAEKSFKKTLNTL